MNARQSPFVSNAFFEFAVEPMTCFRDIPSSAFGGLTGERSGDDLPGVYGEFALVVDDEGVSRKPRCGFIRLIRVADDGVCTISPRAANRCRDSGRAWKASQAGIAIDLGSGKSV